MQFLSHQNRPLGEVDCQSEGGCPRGYTWKSRFIEEDIFRPSRQWVGQFSGISLNISSLETSAVPDRHWPVPGDMYNEGKLTSQLFVAPTFGLVVFPRLASLTGIFLKHVSPPITLQP